MEPIAIIGIGCRFPGDANSPEALWDLLKDGKDVVHDMPWDRREYSERLYSNKSGQTEIGQGVYLKDIDKFEPSFFGIAPKQAAYIDPQQRLLMEVAWEALEDANQVID